MMLTFKFRRDTAANWLATDPVLADGEPGIERDTRRVKYGDGVAKWSALPYASAAVAWGGITGALADQADLKAALDGKQPSDADLSAIAALTTTGFGRGLLTAADAVALRTAAGIGPMEALVSIPQAANVTVGTRAGHGFGITVGTTPGVTMGVGASAVILQSWSNRRLSLNPAGNGVEVGGALTPATDNAIPLGSAALRWTVVYAGSGTIATSDERDKAWLGALSDAHLRAARRIASAIGLFQWLAKLAEHGDAARVHVGVRAQEVARIMVDEGLEAPFDGAEPPSFRHGFLCHDAWEAEYEMKRRCEGAPLRRHRVRSAGERFGIRPDQLALFLIAAQEQRLAALEAATSAR